MLTLAVSTGRLAATLAPGSQAVNSSVVTNAVTGALLGSTLQVVGNLSTVNALLSAGVRYIPAADMHGLDAVTVTVSDTSVSSLPAADPQTATLVIPLRVASVNDAPTVAAGSPSVTVTSGAAPTQLRGVTISDVDANDVEACGATANVLQLSVTPVYGGVSSLRTAGVRVACQ